MKKVLHSIKSIIGRRITFIELDDNLIKTQLNTHCNADKIKITLDNNETISISVEEGSHFYGECDLDISFSKNDSNDSIEHDLGKIKNVFYWAFTPQGFNIFPRKYLVQIELVSDSLAISIGYIIAKPEGTISIDTSSLHINNELIAGNNRNPKRDIIIK